MKKSSFSTLIILAVTMFITSCDKEIGNPGIETIEQKANTIKVRNNSVQVSLIKAEGFPDPCFNRSLNTVFQESFRFTGSAIQWEYKDLVTGANAISFECTHHCANETAKESLVFEVNDGNNIQRVNARKTQHCTFEFWIMAD
ncbi:MAG TPA: hypothetical protein VGD17_16315 [Chitinophagaceae bacterium]